MKSNSLRDNLIEVLKYRGAEEIEPDVWYLHIPNTFIIIYIEMNDPFSPEMHVNLKIETFGDGAISVSKVVNMQILAEDILAMGLGFYQEYLRGMIADLDKHLLK